MIGATVSSKNKWHLPRILGSGPLFTWSFIIPTRTPRRRNCYYAPSTDGEVEAEKWRNSVKGRAKRTAILLHTGSAHLPGPVLPPTSSAWGCERRVSCPLALCSGGPLVSVWLPLCHAVGKPQTDRWEKPPQTASRDTRPAPSGSAESPQQTLVITNEEKPPKPKCTLCRHTVHPSTNGDQPIWRRRMGIISRLQSTESINRLYCPFCWADVKTFPKYWAIYFHDVP